MQEKGVLGLACDLVDIKKEYEAIAKYLLGRIVVVDTIDQALVIARKYKYTLRMVTLEGELLNAGGSMSGGAFRNQSNLLGRRREIEELENSIAVNKKKSAECEEKLKLSKTKILQMSDELNKINEVLHQQYILQNTIQMNLSQAADKQREIELNYEDFKRENTEIGNQINDIKESNDELKHELETYDSLNQSLEDKVTELNQKLDLERNHENSQSEKVDSMKLDFVESNQKLTYLVENIRRIEGEIREQKFELQTIDSGDDGAAKEIEQKLQEIDKINQAIQTALASQKDISEEIQKLNQDKEKMSRNHKDFFAKREELSNRTNELDKEIYRLTSQIDKLNEQMDSQIDYMWAEYELTINMASGLKNPELTNMGELKKNIAKLRAGIRALGDVNVNAIEEFKEVNERYTFLKTQHDDLTEAEKSLKQIISELDIGMRKQFEEKFIQIKTEFDKVFKELFGGGKGTIELNEEEDILEASISIISQPPGKKLQNMMQLSGGEKALTAISLLFAIQNLKPSPFCLLDEIEAALDDSNVSRYANYLHKLTENTQFIVITHRKGTMEAADRLYGITMQEKGISTLVSVDLLDSQLTN